jgi:ribosomal-protein-alanine N-acetyltransferase
MRGQLIRLTRWQNDPRNSALNSASIRRRRSRSHGGIDGEQGFHAFLDGTDDARANEEFLDKVIGWDRDGMPSQFAMIVRSSETLAGYCGFFHHEVDGKMEIEIGYRLDSNFWNRGLTTEAARAVRDHGFRDLKLDYVISLIHPENHPSRRVAEKNGMILERETTFRGFPHFVFAITRERWLQLGCGAE